jgi:hypothetical protein
VQRHCPRHSRRAALTVFGCGYFTCNPSDRVEVAFRNVPAGIHYLSVVVEVDGALRHLDWSIPGGLGVPGWMSPPDCTVSFRNPDKPNEKANYFVRWEDGTRYGVVSRKTDKTWWVDWFEPEAVPLEGRAVVFGGGKAEFDLGKGKREPLPPAQVKALGLEGVRQFKEE